jgi:hypothetical protein
VHKLIFALIHKIFYSLSLLFPEPVVRQNIMVGEASSPHCRQEEERKRERERGFPSKTHHMTYFLRVGYLLKFSECPQIVPPARDLCSS